MTQKQHPYLAFLDAQPELKAALEWAKNITAGPSALDPALVAARVSYNVNILREMGDKLVRYHSLSPKQIAFAVKLHVEGVEKIKNGEALASKQKALVEQGVRAPSGKLQITATVFSIKEVFNDYGPATKCLLDLGNGARVWGTVPSRAGHLQKGDKVTFSATFSVSDRDPLFGFYSRPTNWRNISRPEQSELQPEPEHAFAA